MKTSKFVSLLLVLGLTFSALKSCPMGMKSSAKGSHDCCSQSKKSDQAKHTKSGNTLCCDQAKAGTDAKIVPQSDSHSTIPLYKSNSESKIANSSLSRQDASLQANASPPDGTKSLHTSRAPPQ